MKTDSHDLLHMIQACNTKLLEMVGSTCQEVVHSIHTLAESMTEWTQNMTSQGAGIVRLEHQARFPEGHYRKTESPKSPSPQYPSGPRNKQSESESEYGGKMSQKGRGKKQITKSKPPKCSESDSVSSSSESSDTDSDNNSSSFRWETKNAIRPKPEHRKQRKCATFSGEKKWDVFRETTHVLSTKEKLGDLN